eukprot:Awhi_evm1s12598
MFSKNKLQHTLLIFFVITLLVQISTSASIDSQIINIRRAEKESADKSTTETALKENLNQTSSSVEDDESKTEESEQEKIGEDHPDFVEPKGNRVL